MARPDEPPKPMLVLLLERVAAIMELDEGLTRLELEFDGGSVRQDGSLVTVSYSSAPVALPSGRGAVVSFREGHPA
jgi:hypothetical protein